MFLKLEALPVVPSLRRENCFDEEFVRSLGNNDRFCVECNVYLGDSDREYCEFCDSKELDMDEECPGCESGVDYNGAHMLDGLIHPNCCSKKI